MKKTLIIGLAGMMLFAFTQCGGNKGSKEFQDSKALIEKFEKAIKDAQTCDELQGATFYYALEFLIMDDYAEEDKMTKYEHAKFAILSKKLLKLKEAKAAELGCEDEEEVDEEIELTIEDDEPPIEEAVEETE